MTSSLRFRTVFLSDVHLGRRDARAEYLLDFLRHTDSQQLYLVGDIVDFWSLKNGWYWPQVNNEVVKTILRKARNGTRVVYIPGNHDETLRDYCGMEFSAVRIEREALHRTADGRRLLVTHGDHFDGIVINSRWIAGLGSGVYEALLFLNRGYNFVRRKLGRPYWSLSSYIKYAVKNAMQYIENYEAVAMREVSHRHLDGIVCGHIHHAAVRQSGPITYCNSGDWVESCTALAEDFTGRIRVVRWASESALLLDRGEEIENCDRDGRLVATN